MMDIIHTPNAVSPRTSLCKLLQTHTPFCYVAWKGDHSYAPPLCRGPEGIWSRSRSCLAMPAPRRRNGIWTEQQLASAANAGLRLDLG